MCQSIKDLKLWYLDTMILWHLLKGAGRISRVLSQPLRTLKWYL